MYVGKKFMEKGWLLKIITVYLENTEWCGQWREMEPKSKEQWHMMTGILDRTLLHEVIKHLILLTNTSLSYLKNPIKKVSPGLLWFHLNMFCVEVFVTSQHLLSAPPIMFSDSAGVHIQRCSYFVNVMKTVYLRACPTKGEANIKTNAYLKVYVRLVY
jgi:hypothetical protein